MRDARLNRVDCGVARGRIAENQLGRGDNDRTTPPGRRQRSRPRTRSPEAAGSLSTFETDLSETGSGRRDPSRRLDRYVERLVSQIGEVLRLIRGFLRDRRQTGRSLGNDRAGTLCSRCEGPHRHGPAHAPRPPGGWWSAGRAVVTTGRSKRRSSKTGGTETRSTAMAACAIASRPRTAGKSRSPWKT